MLRASVAFSIWYENSLQRRMNVLSWTPWEGVGNYYQFHHWKWDTEVTRLPPKSLRNLWLARAAPVAPELRSDGATGEFVVASLPTAFLSFLLNLCKAEGRQEEEQLQFLIFYIICFNIYNQLNMISDPNNKFVNSLLEFQLLEVRQKGRKLVGKVWR